MGSTVTYALNIYGVLRYQGVPFLLHAGSFLTGLCGSNGGLNNQDKTSIEELFQLRDMDRMIR